MLTVLFIPIYINIYITSHTITTFLSCDLSHYYYLSILLPLTLLPFYLFSSHTTTTFLSFLLSHHYYIPDHPSPYKIHQTILSIARFLFDFSRKSSSTPDFLRLGGWWMMMMMMMMMMIVMMIVMMMWWMIIWWGWWWWMDGYMDDDDDDMIIMMTMMIMMVRYFDGGDELIRRTARCRDERYCRYYRY